METCEVNTLDTLILYKMSKETARTIMDRYREMSRKDEPVSYLDCILFDTALETLGEYPAYYGLSEEEWQAELDSRKASEKSFGHVLTIDVTKTWKELLGEDRG